MIFCVRATRGRGLPSPGQMARPGKSIAKQSEGRAGEKVARTRGSTELPLKMKLRSRITRTVETTPADSLDCQEIWYTCPTEGGAMTLLMEIQRGRESFIRSSGALRLPAPLFLPQPAASETYALDGTFGIRAIASALDYLWYNSYPITRWSILSSTL